MKETEKSMQILFNICLDAIESRINSTVAQAVEKAMLKALDAQQQNSILLTTNEVVTIYKFSKSTLNLLRKNGMPCLKIGDSVRFERQKIDEFLSNYNKTKSNENC